MAEHSITGEQIEVDYSLIEDEDFWYLQMIAREDLKNELMQAGQKVIDEK